MTQKEHIQHLLDKVLAETATPEELNELSASVQTDLDGTVAMHIADVLQGPETGKTELPSANIADAVFEKILLADKLPDSKPARVFHLAKWAKIAAAVVVLLGLSLFVVLWTGNKSGKISPGDETIASNQSDVSPGGNKAVLTLADGKMIVLDSSANGIVAQQGNASILKSTDGKLVYRPEKNTTAELLYNTISTPRGGQYHITLHDGTEVWLNAASSLHFPAAFTGEERMVELTGEAYFEVHKDAARPFKVKTTSATVQVMGTHFNVMAYDDEHEMKTTLLEGSVKVTGNVNSVLLTPGQQVVAKNNNNLQLINHADTEEAIAWKNGYFQFSKIDAAALRQISRWYDVDVVYEAPVKEKEYTGKINRTVNLSNVAEALKLIGINCKIEKNKLVVLP